jgi:soluble lytic murein transglycosylase-like protein
MPNTAAQLGVKNIFDPEENLSGGARYLAQQINAFGNLRDALAAYNAGPARVERGGALPLETIRYVDKVLSLYEANKSR